MQCAHSQIRRRAYPPGCRTVVGHVEFVLDVADCDRDIVIAVFDGIPNEILQ
jgi:hypothetical protein